MGSLIEDALTTERRVSRRKLSVLGHLCLATDAVHAALWELRDRLSEEGDALDDSDREIALEAIEELERVHAHIERADWNLGGLVTPVAV